MESFEKCPAMYVLVRALGVQHELDVTPNGHLTDCVGCRASENAPPKTCHCPLMVDFKKAVNYLDTQYNIRLDSQTEELIEDIQYSVSLLAHSKKVPENYYLNSPRKVGSKSVPEYMMSFDFSKEKCYSLMKVMEFWTRVKNLKIEDTISVYYQQGWHMTDCPIWRKKLNDNSENFCECEENISDESYLAERYYILSIETIEELRNQIEKQIQRLPRKRIKNCLNRTVRPTGGLFSHDDDDLSNTS